jgi:hypothetical protein
MGIFSMSCSISGVPVGSSCQGVEPKNYTWVRKVRAVLKDGTVTEIGFYTDYGSIIVNDKEYKVIDKTMSPDEINHDGFIIIDKVYQMLLENQDYYDYIEGENLYQLIKDRGCKVGLGLIQKYIHNQYITITVPEMKDNFISPVVEGSDEIYLFTDPDVCKENYEEIDKIVSLFISYF